jgi:hypothetical protein
MKRYLSILFLGLCITGCKKYDIEPQIKDPAYIRVFNNLTPTLDVIHGQQSTPFLTFLMDPQTDAAGIPADAAIIGDYLGTRQLFSWSYSGNEANSAVGNNTTGPFNGQDLPNLTPINYEYPGTTHVLTAPVINGFDLSAWAQVPSGKHRIVFVTRPQNGIGFKDLSATIRNSILLDTTLNFEKGEVYTMEVLSRDLDNGKYGLYIRKEQFIHQAFESDKLYLGFVNLSGKTTAEVKQGFRTAFPEKVKITGSYLLFNDAASQGGGNVFYNPVPGYDNTYFTSLSTTMDTAISWHPLPMLEQDAFFYQGLLRNYAPNITSEPVITSNQGSMPYFRFVFMDADAPVYDPNSGVSFLLSCSADPAVYNNFNATTTGVTGYTPNLNLVINSKGAYHIYPTLNIMEMVYDRVYLMQIVRGFEQVPKN